MHSAGLTIKFLDLPEKEGGLGGVARENDEMEGRQGLGKSVTHRIKEFRRL